MEVVDAARWLEPQVGAIIITGEGGKAFAAGADIRELAQLTYEQVARRGKAACLYACHNASQRSRRASPCDC